MTLIDMSTYQFWADLVVDNCFQVFLNCMIDTLITPGWSNFTFAAGEAAEFGFTAVAWNHAALRGLSYPMKSSIVRRFLSLASRANPIAVWSTIVLAEVTCITTEVNCANGN